jgi:hypothetical protein
MNKQLLALCCVASATLGLIIYASFNEWIIFRNPWENPLASSALTTHLCKKNVSLFFWRYERWHKETVTLSLAPQEQEQIVAILQTWLSEAFQLRVIDKPCTLESALIDTRHQCLYLSFSTCPFNTQKATVEQLSMLESMLKTIQLMGYPNINSVQFLVNHTLIKHPHINLSKPVNLTGFKILPD